MKLFNETNVYVQKFYNNATIYILKTLHKIKKNNVLNFKKFDYNVNDKKNFVQSNRFIKTKTEIIKFLNIKMTNINKIDNKLNIENNFVKKK